MSPVPLHAPDVASPATLSSDRRVRDHARWARDRARNALRRPARMATVGGAVFVVVLLMLILVPRQGRRAGAALMPRPDEWRDTAAAITRLSTARVRAIGAERAFVAARRAATAPPPEPEVVVRVLTPAEAARRDTLQRVEEELRPLLARAERAPLPASFRAVGEAAALAGNRELRALLDSLAAVEAEREAFGALGGVDPVYVSLTTRANALGREIVSVAQARVDAARRELAALTTTVVRTPVLPPEVTDTLTPQRRLAEARAEMRVAASALDAARAHNARLAEREAEARRRAGIGAPPLAVLLAALVLGVVVGYGTVLGGELLVPRVAGVAEAERVSRARVLTVVRPHPPLPESGRRQADLLAPPLLDARADAYRLLHLSVAATGSTLPVVTVTGEEPAVVATVAANLAARAAMEARSTALVDLDRREALVAGVLRVRRGPGMGEIFAGLADVPESTVSALIGRDLALDVIPGGGAHPDARSPGEVRAALARLAARHDLVVVAAPLSYASLGEGSALPAPDVVVCARVAVTRVRDLALAAATLRRAGLRVHGLVLWDQDGPHVEPRAESR
ncbi:MAG TPA: hypothetical protein VFY16_10395 [Gemmatimonadaceae bacterium]|nr:hypothetical protein [Gemmatimonadaceae bacterium]